MLLTKTEGLGADTLAALEARLARINLRVPVALVPSKPAELAALFALDAFVLSDVVEQSPGFLTKENPSGLSRGGGDFRSFVRHDDDIASLVLHHPGEVDVGLMGSFVEELLLKNGNDMLRYKGILAVRGEDRRLVFQGVHRITGFDYGRDWADGEARETTIVIIGRRLDEAAIRAGFQLACR